MSAALYPGDRAFYISAQGQVREVVIARSREISEGRTSVLFCDGPSCEMDVPTKNLFPCYQPHCPDVDRDLADFALGASHQDLVKEIGKLRAAFRWMLSQEGDDLCWMDIYRVAASVLPESDALLAKKRLALPKALMRRNCEKYIDSMCDGGEYSPCSPEAAIQEMEKELAVLREKVRDLETIELEQRLGDDL